MPVLAIILLAILIASFGFWDTLQALLGAVGVFVLIAILAVAAVAAGASALLRKGRRGITNRGER